MSRNYNTTKGIITIRLAIPADASAIRTLRLEALMLHPEAFSADLEMTAAEGNEIWAERIAGYTTTGSGAISIAINGKILVGMTGIGRGHWPKRRHLGTIWGVYVSQEWRGYHVAEQLINECVEWAKVNEVCVINLGVNISNVSAICCYSRTGFTIYGVEPRALYLNGVYYDELLMARLI
jgi:ribosomal protein S18 acetylase RimI-like enzyme